LDISAEVLSSIHEIAALGSEGLGWAIQSTSPASLREVEPMVVRTMEQNWVLVFMGSESRDSISGRVEAAQGVLRVERASNL